MPPFYSDWEFPPSRTDEASAIRSQTGFSAIASEILQARVGPDPEAIEEWIHPRLENLLDPDSLPFCKAAAERIEKALREGSSTGVFSDYDVDGISSAALLSGVLQDLGGSCTTFVPDRIEEGYGLSFAALERAFSENKPDLLVVLDCGTRSEKELHWIHAQGVPTVVVDHHKRETAPGLPPDCVLVNPHLPDRSAPPFQNHCTVGLVFKVLHSLLRVMERKGESPRERVDLRRSLDLVALGTVADLVPLRGENRIFVRHGLRELARTGNHGLRALLQVAGVDADNPLSSTDIGYRIGPRINAGGRIDTGRTALDLLGTTDNRLAFHLARKLDATNRERQGVERRVLEEATERIGPHPPWAIVAGDRSWHPGVVGIVAGRLARKYHRPAIVFGWDGSSMKGSGRGIPGIDLLAVMDTCSFPPRQWGGHPAAMGLSLAEEDLEPFAEAFAAAVKEACEGELPEKSLSIDAVADPGAIDRSCVLELEALGPFGQGNPEPILAIRGAVLERPPAPMGRDHIRFELSANPSLRFIGWRMAANPPPTGTPVDLAVRPSRSFWRGRESLRAEVVDWRPAADDGESRVAT